MLISNSLHSYEGCNHLWLDESGKTWGKSDAYEHSDGTLIISIFGRTKNFGAFLFFLICLKIIIENL